MPIIGVTFLVKKNTASITINRTNLDPLLKIDNFNFCCFADFFVVSIFFRFFVVTIFPDFFVVSIFPDFFVVIFFLIFH